MRNLKPFIEHADWEYDLTDKQVLALKAFVEKLNEEDRRAYFVWKKLSEQAETMLSEKIIDDYYIDIKLNCFSCNPTVNKKYGVDEDGEDTIAEIFCSFFDNEKTHFENWNEDSLFGGMHFSYTAHCVFFHDTIRFCNGMSFHDMLSIDRIWRDIEITYQTNNVIIEENN